MCLTLTIKSFQFFLFCCSLSTSFSQPINYNFLQQSMRELFIACNFHTLSILLSLFFTLFTINIAICKKIILSDFAKCYRRILINLNHVYLLSIFLSSSNSSQFVSFFSHFFLFFSFLPCFKLELCSRLLLCVLCCYSIRTWNIFWTNKNKCERERKSRKRKKTSRVNELFAK